MNENESEKQNPQERRNAPSVVVDGPKEWVKESEENLSPRPPKPPMLWAKSKAWADSVHDEYRWAYRLENTNLWCLSRYCATRADDLIVDEAKSDTEAVAQWKQDLEELK